MTMRAQNAQNHFPTIFRDPFFIIFHLFHSLIFRLSDHSSSIFRLFIIFDDYFSMQTARGVMQNAMCKEMMRDMLFFIIIFATRVSVRKECACETSAKHYYSFPCAMQNAKTSLF